MNRQRIFIAGAAFGALLTAIATGVTIALEWRGFFRPSLRSRLVYRVMHFYRLPADANVAQIREVQTQMTGRIPLPDGLAVEPVDVDGIPAEWVTPAGVEGDRVLLYLHGGCYVSGSPQVYRDLTGRMARAAGLRALVVDYRLAPEHPYPAALDDAHTAFHWLLRQGIDPGKIMLAGDSAGGGLAVALLLRLRDAGEPLPAGGVLFSPWVDLAGTGASIFARAREDVMLNWPMLKEQAAHYAGSESVRHPLISPLYADLHGLPPLLIQVGGKEILLHDATRLAERVEAAGGDVTLDRWPQMWHVWQITAGIVPEAQQAIAHSGDFIRARLGRSDGLENG